MFRRHYPDVDSSLQAKCGVEKSRVHVWNQVVCLPQRLISTKAQESVRPYSVTVCPFHLATTVQGRAIVVLASSYGIGGTTQVIISRHWRANQCYQLPRLCQRRLGHPVTVPDLRCSSRLQGTSIVLGWRWHGWGDRARTCTFVIHAS
jgi:hypothetical protein